MRNKIFIFSLLLSLITSDIIRDNIQRVKDKNHQAFLDDFQKYHHKFQGNLRNQKNRFTDSAASAALHAVILEENFKSNKYLLNQK